MDDASRSNLEKVPEANLFLIVVVLMIVAVFTPYVVNTFQGKIIIGSLLWQITIEDSSVYFFVYEAAMIMTPIIILRTVFVGFVARWFQGKTNRKVVILTGILCESIVLFMLFSQWLSILLGVTTFEFACPLPIPLLVALLIGRIHPPPKPITTAFGDEEESKKWWIR